MVYAYVFIDCSANTAEDILSAVGGIDVVREAHVVTGDFDVVAEITAEEVYDVLAAVTREIRSLDGVGTTRTYVALE